eukprot:TRINITY_DN27092_c0_g1_i1.p1 TRINITY_DN27092_c0_g1~~TRINITY_DN27092_c0_g1_i1.p1  ORF type:complete len:991 (-),score=128.34 TRINITY_DN27092_c0_g1_i1:81-2912(-)
MVAAVASWNVPRDLAAELGSAAAILGGLGSCAYPASSRCSAACDTFGSRFASGVQLRRREASAGDAMRRCEDSAVMRRRQNSAPAGRASVTLHAVSPDIALSATRNTTTGDAEHRPDTSARRAPRRRQKHARTARASGNCAAVSSSLSASVSAVASVTPKQSPTPTPTVPPVATVASGQTSPKLVVKEAATPKTPEPPHVPPPAATGPSAPPPPKTAPHSSQSALLAVSVGAAVEAQKVRQVSVSASTPALPSVAWASPRGSPSPSPTRSSSPTSPFPSPSSRPTATAKESKLVDGGAVREVAALSSSVAMSTPSSASRTPRTIEVSVESQEASVPTGVWTSDGCLEASAGDASCNITVMASLGGRGGVHAVLRVGLFVEGPQGAPPAIDGFRQVARVRFGKTALHEWATLRVSGAEECDIGRFPSGSPSTSSSSSERSGSPRMPLPGLCKHSWSEEGALISSGENVAARESGELTAAEAIALGSAVVRADFFCGLSLHVSAFCTVHEGGQSMLRVEVAGELHMRPRFRLVGREGAQRLYATAKRRFCAGGEDLQALRECEEALATLDGLQPMPPEAGDVLNLLGALHLRRQSPRMAVTCLKRALAVRAVHVGAEDVALASTLNTLGSAYQMLGEHSGALSAFQRAVDIFDAAAAQDRVRQGAEGSVVSTWDPALAKALHSLGGAHRALGQNVDARKHYERSLEIRQRAFGEDHPLNSTTLNNLGAVLQQLCDNRGAVRCYQRALDLQTRSYGNEHCATAATLSNLGSAHGRVGDHRCAILCHRRAHDIQERLFGAEHPAVAASLHNLGNALAADGKGPDALRCLWRALAVWSKTLGNAHPDIAATLHSLGNVYRGLSQPEEAVKCFAGALRIRDAALGPEHPETARTRHCAALCACATGQSTAALQELETASSSMVSSLGAAHPWSLQVRADKESLRESVDG